MSGLAVREACHWVNLSLSLRVCSVSYIGSFVSRREMFAQDLVNCIAVSLGSSVVTFDVRMIAGIVWMDECVRRRLWTRDQAVALDRSGSFNDLWISDWMVL